MNARIHRGGRRLFGAAKIGCTAQTLNEWVKKAEIDSGKRAGVPTDMAEKLKALERENRELRQANEILRKASAYFAQAELDRRVEAMIAFIDDHREAYGVEPICRVLPRRFSRSTLLMELPTARPLPIVSRFMVLARSACACCTAACAGEAAPSRPCRRC